ncbi:MAG: hypothetical protein QOJ23_6010, partial [Actinomycetota bacterium]|nr:hypothetical protein [Actinomycetota bacterium]
MQRDRGAAVSGAAVAPGSSGSERLRRWRLVLG